jgi:hypothetical protein
MFLILVPRPLRQSRVDHDDIFAIDRHTSGSGAIGFAYEFLFGIGDGHALGVVVLAEVCRD